jgi:F-type H+-transporting ATPase subunit a
MDVMTLKQISPDQVIFRQWGPVHLNATIVYTWAVMGIMVIGSWAATRKLTSDVAFSRWQNLLEIIVDGMRSEIRQIGQRDRRSYLYFVGTLFLFIFISNLLNIVPGYVPPTASLSTTAGLAICVFVAVPVYGIMSRGIIGYLRQYIKPSVFMLPFNIMGEVSRTLALAVRLFGNIMSGMKIVAILLALTPLIFPVVMHALGLLTGIIQAYIFAVLAMVYIASGTRVQEEKQRQEQEKQEKKGG